MNQYFDNNENLESNIKESYVKVLDTNFYLYTDNGVFNKSGLDFGTRVLLENIDIINKKTFLDVGCGCGPIGIYILLNINNAQVDMIDINERALKLTKMGLKKNRLNANVLKSDAYENITNKYDMIITNPPIRVGKKILYQILFDAKKYLNPHGHLICVINKDQGAKSVVKDLEKEYKVEILNKNKGFFVIDCIFS